MGNRTNKHVILKGEGINQHVLHGNLEIEDQPEFTQIAVADNTVLKHEKPDGSHAEHETLAVKDGTWVMGKQVEFNPFTQRITRIWD